MNLSLPTPPKPCLWAAMLLPAMALPTIGLGDEPSEKLFLSKDDAEKLVSISPTTEAKPSGSDQGFRDILSGATPAVVSVFPSRFADNQDLGSEAIDRFFGGRNSDEDRAEGVGSGVVLSPDGWIVTNSHVVKAVTGENFDSIIIELHDRTRFQASLVGVDEKTDLALLKVNAKDLHSIPIGDSEQVATGDAVLAIGNPFQVGITATMGMVSGTDRSNLQFNGPEGIESFIQTDAAINPGNSGGALIDRNGRLIGINTGILSHGGGGNLGIGFAIPARLMRHVVAHLAQFGEVKRGKIGLLLGKVPAKPESENHSVSGRGVLVKAAMPNGPAALAGVQEGDLILKVGEKAIDFWSDARFELSFFSPGETIELHIVRNGEEMVLPVTAQEISEAEREAGFTIGRLPRVTFRVKDSEVEVISVGDYRPDVGDWFHVGMKIQSINKEPVDSAKSIDQKLKEGVNRVVVEFLQRQRTLAIRVKAD